MTDLDSRIQTLVNAAVDRELAGHRVAPPWQPPHRSGHPIARWSLPALAASVAALLVAVTVLAIGHGRSAHPAPAHPAAPTPTPSPSVSRSVNPDLEAAHRAYAEAVAGAREATEVPGVTVGPVSAKDAARYRNSGLFGGGADIPAPVPGRTYSFTLSYLAGPSDEPPAVLTSEIDGVASGSCAAPFLVRPNHSYLIHCQVRWLAGATGRTKLTLRTPAGTESDSMNLTDPAANYARALEQAPEASAVAGVSDLRATADQRQSGGDSVGLLDGPVALPEAGRKYAVTLLYVPALDAPAVSVLVLRFEDVATARCPAPFRVRPGHAYHIRCQVSFVAGATGMAYFDLTAPAGADGSSGIGISSP